MNKRGLSAIECLLSIAVICCFISLFSCSEPGKYTDWQCLKKDTTLAPGISTNGSYATTVVTTCSVSRCARYEIVDSGKWFLPNKTEILELLPDERCL